VIGTDIFTRWALNFSFEISDEIGGYMLAAITFLGLNGFEFDATEEDVVGQIVALAAGRSSEPELAQWIRAHAVREK